MVSNTCGWHKYKKIARDKLQDHPFPSPIYSRFQAESYQQFVELSIMAFNTNMCTIRLPHANLSTFHIFFNTYYHINKTHNYFKIVNSIWINK